MEGITFLGKGLEVVVATTNTFFPDDPTKVVKLHSQKFSSIAQAYADIDIRHWLLLVAQNTELKRAEDFKKHPGKYAVLDDIRRKCPHATEDIRYLFKRTQNACLSCDQIKQAYFDVYPIRHNWLRKLLAVDDHPIWSASSITERKKYSDENYERIKLELAQIGYLRFSDLSNY